MATCNATSLYNKLQENVTRITWPLYMYSIIFLFFIFDLYIISCSIQNSLNIIL